VRERANTVIDAADRAEALAAQGLESLLDASDPLTRYIGLERYGNSTALLRGHRQIEAEYSPDRGPTSFPLPIYWVRWGEAIEVGIAHPTASACPPEMAPVAIHPAAAAAPARNPDELLNAVPTSSGRTVLIPSPTGLEFLKLHHPGVLGRFPRPLNLAKWLSGLEVWALIAGSDAELSCRVMPEPGGVYLDSDDRRGFGCIRRYDEWLWQRMGHGAQLYPFFSILRRGCDGSPLVFERIARDAATTPTTLCLRIVELLVTAFWELAWGLGLIPEFHTQNCLLLVGPDGTDLTLVIRDLTDVRVDVSRRAELGLESVVSCYAAMHRDRPEDYFPFRSYAYDRNLGEVVVQRLVTCAAAGDATVERELLAEARRIAFRALPPDEAYFRPSDRCFAYSAAQASPELVDTGRHPILR
jgi:hypothetical protein